MKEEIKEILENVKKCCDVTKGQSFTVYQREDILKLLDYITNLQQENERLKKISHKMHLWIFLNCGDEQKVYDELGLTDEENAMLGYSGQFRMGSDKE